MLVVMLPFMRDGFANPSALHTGAKKDRRAVEEARCVIADRVFPPRVMVFVSGREMGRREKLKLERGGGANIPHSKVVIPFKLPLQKGAITSIVIAF